MASQEIRSPDDPLLDELCAALAAKADGLDSSAAWPEEQLALCGQYGVFRWFLPERWGGFDWDEAAQVRGYLRLSAACLTTTFILTQRSGACRRIADCAGDEVCQQMLPALAQGTAFTTLGISHLTTSRRHLSKPILTVEETDAGYVLNGYSAWVTGASHADSVVVGAALADGQQILLVVPTSLPGVKADPPARLVGLSSSHTGALRLSNVEVDRRWLLAGPSENVMASAAGAKTGGLQTSTLAIGLASTAVAYLFEQAQKRPEFEDSAAGLGRELATLRNDLLQLADGNETCTPDDVRARANSLVLRTAQAALAAAKGVGYVLGHPAGRWCREALFFLVWSCPQPVLAANMCELAGLAD